MRRLKEWWADPRAVDRRDVELIAAGGYLVGWLLAMAYDRWAARRAAALIDQEFEKLGETFRSQVEAYRAAVPRPDAEGKP